MTKLEAITFQMNTLENDISRQQLYINKHGDENDVNTDAQWEQYKKDAEYNLNKWDAMKEIRDGLKAAA